MAYRRALRKLKRVGKAEDRVQGSRLGAKLDHLRIKHSKSLKERSNTTTGHKPKWRDKYPINIYDELEDPDLFEELLQEIDRERDREEVMTIGGVMVNENEKAVLRLHPSTGVLGKPDARQFCQDEEVMLAKSRYGLREVMEHDRDWAEGLETVKYWDLDEATKILRVEAEASFRQVF